MRLKRSVRSTLNLGSVGSLTTMLLGLMLLSIIFGGCAAKRPLLYPLENDFRKMENGWFMSDFYLCNVMGVDVQGVNCDEVKTNG